TVVFGGDGPARDDLEAAVRAATKLSRTRPRDDLVRIWTRGRVAEYRGEIEAARRLYRRGRVTYPDFVPFITGALRVAFVQFDRKAVDRLVNRLNDRNPDHSYGLLAEVEFPRVGGSRDGEAEEKNDGEAAATSESVFIQAVRRYRQAVSALYGGRFEKAVDRASELVGRRDHFGPAFWVRAVARAALFEVEAASGDFGRIAGLSGLARRYQWQLRRVAPTMLAAAGRPDLGAKYIVPGEGPIPVRPRRPGRDGAGDKAAERETIVPRTSRWNTAGSEESFAKLKRGAELARIRVLVELGHHGRAARLLAALRDRTEDRESRLAVLAAEIEARRGRRPAGPGEWARESASREARLVDAFYSGRFDRAIELGGKLLEETPSVDLVRYVALSYAATDRGRRALRTLERADLSVLARPALDRVRARIVSRLWHRDAPQTRGIDRLEGLEPTSTQAAVDLAAVMLWKHRVEAAESWSQKAWKRAPDYPEANWMRGLILRLRDGGQSERFLTRSWRADGDGVRLSMELGYANLGLDKHERARDLFYSALLADPTSVEAIRGLGRAYHGFSPRKGRWNFERFLENYEGEPSRAVQAAEVLRWLGVFHGVREGHEKGRTYLDRAVDRAGRRPVLLLELARYHRARDQRDEARRLYVDVLERDSTMAEAHLGLARVAGASDNEATMQTHLNRYLDLQPTGRHAAWVRKQLDELEASASETDGNGPDG
ncbi:MAG: tetratricopeptide repeat protein, partial [Bradymonadaceae bacterium]